MWNAIKDAAKSQEGPEVETDDQNVIYDQKGQLKKIREYIRPYETLKAVFDMKGGGTGFIAITDRRLIVYDKQFLSRHKALVTIPFSRVTRIAANENWGTSKLAVIAGTEAYEFEFWSGDKARKAYELITDALIG